ncbi:MAG: hypothetical protein M3178_02490 [Pseudomonadota bacterium]|nr:hypothetical protein [Pseudomonadota bacterium]
MTTSDGADLDAIEERAVWSDGGSTPKFVSVVSQDGNQTLALHVVCHGEDGQALGNPNLMRPLGDGRYHATLDDLPEGAFKITVQSATPAKPIDPDWALVWDADAV